MNSEVALYPDLIHLAMASPNYNILSTSEENDHVVLRRLQVRKEKSRASEREEKSGHCMLYTQHSLQAIASKHDDFPPKA